MHSRFCPGKQFCQEDNAHTTLTHTHTVGAQSVNKKLIMRARMKKNSTFPFKKSCAYRWLHHKIRSNTRAQNSCFQPCINNITGLKCIPYENVTYSNPEREIF